jgi:site-specific DNA recombinase
MTIPCRMKVRGGRTWLTLPDGQPAGVGPRVDPVLVTALRSAHAMLSQLGGAPVGVPEAAMLAQAPARPYDRRVICLAFLAPDLQRDILEGRQPAGLTLQRLVMGRIPSSWNEQRAAFS